MTVYVPAGTSLIVKLPSMVVVAVTVTSPVISTSTCGIAFPVEAS